MPKHLYLTGIAHEYFLFSSLKGQFPQRRYNSWPKVFWARNSSLADPAASWLCCWTVTEPHPYRTYQPHDNSFHRHWAGITLQRDDPKTSGNWASVCFHMQTAYIIVGDWHFLHLSLPVEYIQLNRKRKYACYWRWSQRGEFAEQLFLLCPTIPPPA